MKEPAWTINVPLSVLVYQLLSRPEIWHNPAFQTGKPCEGADVHPAVTIMQNTHTHTHTHKRNILSSSFTLFSRSPAHQHELHTSAGQSTAQHWPTTNHKWGPCNADGFFFTLGRLRERVQQNFRCSLPLLLQEELLSICRTITMVPPCMSINQRNTRICYDYYNLADSQTGII